MTEADYNILKIGKEVLSIESRSILAAADNLNINFINACRIIINCKGKVIFSGIGKSGIIARKIASTFTSTGSPSAFLHPAEAAHGDLGIMKSNDVLIAISQSGKSQELQLVISYAKRLGLPIIFFTSHISGELAQLCDYCINTSVAREACPLGLAPTASSSVCLALGDALAMTVLNQRGFTTEDFRELHPAGGLGQRLQRVKDIMHKGKSLPLISHKSSIKEILILMSNGDVRGACGVINDQNQLVGIITDGDLRRKLLHGDMSMHTPVSEIMTLNPQTIHPNELAQKALYLMQEFRISVLFVIDPETKSPLGILHIQDLLKNTSTT